MGKSFSERYLAPNWKFTASVHSSRLDEAVATTRSKRKFNNQVSFDEKRPLLTSAGHSGYILPDAAVFTN